jgi:hypothetical protein
MGGFLLNFFKGMNLNKILTFATIIATFVAIFSGVSGLRAKNDAKRYQNILHEKTVEYEDELGRKVKEVTQLQVTTKELKKLADQDSATLNAYEKRLLKVYNELAANKRKLKRTEAALSFTSQTKDSFAIQLETLSPDNIVALEMADMLTEFSGITGEVPDSDFKPKKIGYYSNDWTSQEFLYDPNTDSLYVSQVSENEFFVDMFKQREQKENGKDYIWPIRLFKDWEYKASIKSLRDSTVIKDAVIVNVSKR